MYKDVLGKLRMDKEVGILVIIWEVFWKGFIIIVIKVAVFKNSVGNIEQGLGILFVIKVFKSGISFKISRNFFGLIQVL